MKRTLTIRLKVTGVQAEKLKIRRKLEDGRLTNEQQLVVLIPVFGVIPLDPDMEVTIYDTAAPVEERKWVKTNAKDLLAELLAGKYSKNQNTTPLN